MKYWFERFDGDILIRTVGRWIDNVLLLLLAKSIMFVLLKKLLECVVKLIDLFGAVPLHFTVVDWA